MTESQTITIRGYAMWTASGHDGPSSVAAMRAEMSGATQAMLWDRGNGERLPACRVHAHQWWEGETYLPYLAAPVIAEAQERAAELGHDPREVPVILCVAPPGRAGRSAKLEEIVTEGIPALLGRPWPQGSTVIPRGRTALPWALGRARRSGAGLAIVLGVESLLQQVIADHYRRDRRLLGSSATSGLILGEAAAAVLVSPGRGQGLVLTGFGRGQEPSRDGGSRDTPVTGEGLTQAMRSALEAAGHPFHDITVTLGDLNGEHYRFKEQAFAVTRLDRLPPENRSRRPRGHVEHWNVVRCIGECGAAILPAALGWAFEAGRSGFLPGRAMIFAGEDDGERIAMTGEWCDG
ncbi:3-oxoacyl-ACP synthase [Citreicella sp. C3M06]|uniref:3-oxoacyl-ACP synthase n=1 Tax=Roseobacteraceae TaxID=2854170 RepID=UPI001C08C077|nr:MULTISPECIES: 3-oxoacyl-ACP synthase [Roseobacteraceae]MBU2959873.1 3-oxoacyl-ACP synthase [Citreicella sp. C3M06]MDO6587956.1 3-oxoacyl-ACP synthase [Salipiger sp. 1_MG-2023]